MDEKNKKVKLDPVLIRDLRSGENRLILKSLQKLRIAGNIGYIPELLKLIHKTENKSVRKELVRFISDIKNPSIIPFILTGLKDPHLKEARGSIISTCWQSGLDYSSNIGLFIQLFFDGDYATAIEAFTVIEEAALNLGMVELKKAHDLLQKGLSKVNEEKKPLALELVRLFQ